MNSLKREAEIIFQNSNRKKRNFNEMTGIETNESCSDFNKSGNNSKRYKLDQDGNYNMSMSQDQIIPDENEN